MPTQEPPTKTGLAGQFLTGAEILRRISGWQSRSSASPATTWLADMREQAAPPAQRPLLIAHRGGTADAPENTMPAINRSLKAGVDGVWLSVQATRDGVPVLYRPTDLKELTNGSGAVADKTYAELSGLNAGHHFTDRDGRQPYRHAADPVRIPTVAQALAAIPEGKEIYLDLKQTPAAHVVGAVSRLLDEQKAWGRVHLYSTDQDTTRMLRDDPRARVAESRDATRQRLAENALEDGACKSTPDAAWVGFELKRKMMLTETFMLGKGNSPVFAQLWTKNAIDCFRKERPGLPIVMFGVNTPSDLKTAARLGATAVLIDSPETIVTRPTASGYSQARSAEAAFLSSVSTLTRISPTGPRGAEPPAPKAGARSLSQGPVSSR